MLDFERLVLCKSFNFKCCSKLCFLWLLLHLHWMFFRFHLSLKNLPHPTQRKPIFSFRCDFPSFSSSSSYICILVCFWKCLFSNLQVRTNLQTSSYWSWLRIKYSPARCFIFQSGTWRIRTWHWQKSHWF